MNENIKKRTGIGREALFLLGNICLLLGLIGQGIIKNRLLYINSTSSQELLNMLNSANGMSMATTALALEALESCGVPIFALITIDGLERTSNAVKYIFRVLILAIICEIPYNFAEASKLIDLSSRNPVFGVALCLIMLYLFKSYEGKAPKQILVKLCVFLTALLWAILLNSKFSIMMLCLSLTLWILKERATLRFLFGAAVAICFCVVNPLYMFAPFGFLACFIYNNQIKGRHSFFSKEPLDNKLPAHYLYYPIMLIIISALGIII